MSRAVNLELKVGEVFEINGLTLPLVGDTATLVSKMKYSENGLKLLNSATNSGKEGKLYEKIYVFQTLKEGEYEVDLYFSEFNSEEKWMPDKNSTFYGRHEKIIKVKVQGI